MFRKTVLEKQYTSPSKWGQTIQSYIKIERTFSFRNGLWYSVTVPNFGCSRKKLLDALLIAVEHESIGMGKYNGLKEKMYGKKLWNHIC